jgi:hypothetical protein
MVKIGQVLEKLRSGKVLAAAVLVAAVISFGTSSVASAAPSYFNVDKPSSPSQCDGSSSTWEWEWKWERNTSGPWWTHFWFGHWVKVEHKVKNWEKLGFDSKGQCVRYTSTKAPESRRECREDWWQLGFKNRGQCVAYLRMHGGGGYGGGA